MYALRADRRRSSRGPFCALPLLSFVCSGQALALFPSHNCQPTQSFVLRAMYKVSRSFPRTPGVRPSFSYRPSFTTLLSSSLSSLFYGAHHPCFADSFFFLGEALVPPSLLVYVSYLAVPRILFVRVIVLRVYIPGETRARNGIFYVLFACCEFEYFREYRRRATRSTALDRFNSDE